MDDIYGNLENYNDANVLSELLVENKQLKSKLEEYSGTMIQLQKDFDKLNSEYKKLEVNYSSLLKTAKAEIERKTNMITQLNIEKDKLVINAMQKTGRNILLGQPKKEFGNSKNNYDSSSDSNKGNRNRPELTDSNPDNRDDWRHKRLPSETCSPISSIGTVNSTSNEDEKKMTDSKKYPVDIKNNVAKGSHMETLPMGTYSNRTANKIIHRRKSMPVLSEQDVKFSSDEDRLGSVEAKEINVRKNTKQSDRTSGLEETPKNNESSRDKNKTKKRNRNKHLPNQKSRKYSPEREKKRTTKVTTNDHSNRSGYRRQRVLESPPSNKYNRSKSRDHRSEKERRNNRSQSRDRRIEIERRDCNNQSKTHDSRIDMERRDCNNQSKSHDRRIDFEKRDCSNQSKSHDRRFEFENRECDNRSNSHDRRMNVEKRDCNIQSKSHDRRIEFEKRDRDNRSKSRDRRIEIEIRNCDNRSRSRDRRIEIITRDYDNRSIYGDLERGECYNRNNSWDLECYQQKQYPTKNKRSDYEEQSNKRRKTEAYFDDGGWRHMDDDVNMPYNDCHTTCQSPDFNNLDTNPPHHYVREIIHTATVKLDDPRITSKRYVLKKQDGKISFNRLSAKEVDIKSVNKSIWGIEKVEVPEALKNNPSAVQVSDNIVHEIYMDIENPCLKVSRKSCELKSLEDEECLRIPETSTANLNKLEVQIKNPKTNNDQLKTHETVIKVLEKIELPQITSENIKSLPSNYKIPKVQKTNNEENSSFKKSLNNSIKSDPREISTIKESSMPEQADKCVESCVNDDFVENDRNEKVLCAKDIEGDLEMTDEEGDDFHNTIIQQKNKIDEFKPLSELRSNEEAKSFQEPDESKTEKKSDQKYEISGKDKPITKKKVTDLGKDSKKHKSKKSRQDHKNTVSIDEDVSLEDKRPSTNNTDNNTKESQLNKNKFSELFGDSNSLITPDELGIQVSEMIPEQYTSVFDDTQDAIDLSLEEMERIKKDLKFKLDKLSSEVVECAPCDNSTVPKKTGTDEDVVKQIDRNTENLNVSVNDSVVKTVIISTGTQPDCVIENSTKDQRKTEEHGCETTSNAAKNIALDSIKALATSTPHKLASDVPVVDACGNDDSEMATKDANALPIPNPTNSIPCEAKSETDAPDMRIFVKRRRKIKKP